MTDNKYNHDMFCTCPECIKLKGGASNTSKGSKYSNEAISRHVKFISGLSPHNLHRREEALKLLLEQTRINAMHPSTSKGYLMGYKAGISSAIKALPENTLHDGLEEFSVDDYIAQAKINLNALKEDKK